MNDFHLYAGSQGGYIGDKTSTDQRADDAYQTGGALISNHMPFNDMKFYETFNKVVPKIDTIDS